MDVGLISFVIAALGVHWGISKPEGALIASAGFVGMAIGATLGGRLASIGAPLLTPILVATDGQTLAFGVFAAAFAAAALAALTLPELRGTALAD